MSHEFLLRVRELPKGGFVATCRQVCGPPEDRSTVGAPSSGLGLTETAALCAAMASHRTETVHEVRRVS